MVSIYLQVLWNSAVVVRFFLQHFCPPKPKEVFKKHKVINRVPRDSVWHGWFRRANLPTWYLLVLVLYSPNAEVFFLKCYGNFPHQRYHRDIFKKIFFHIESSFNFFNNTSNVNYVGTRNSLQAIIETADLL